MNPPPETGFESYRGAEKLRGKVALVTGGDSGIGRAVSIAFAKEGADVAIVYLNEDEDARETERMLQEAGSKCLLIRGDIGDEEFCREAVDRCIENLGAVDVLVNNAGEQHTAESITAITAEQIERTFRTNVFSMFYLIKAALPHMREGSAIVNSASVTAFRGSSHLLDYAATKGAIVAFTRSLAAAVADRKIRVNSVAPGPVWTPLIPASFPAEKVESFGANTLMERPGEPREIAPSYVFLACEDSSYMTGQTLHPNGGQIVGG